MSSKPHGVVRAQSLVDVIAQVIATSAGLGYAPIAPGTVGSVAGVVLFFLAGRSFTLGLIAALLVTVIGIWAATRTVRLTGDHDPSRVVIDEVAGQFLTLWLAWHMGLLFDGRSPDLELAFVGAGFLLFRIFDIIKPAPARRLEKLREGIGVVADDIKAGIYAGLMLYLMNRWGIW